MSYLADLTLRLFEAVAGLPNDLRERHAALVIRRQADDGGFAGRKGSSDPYYTGFAVRSLAVLGRLDKAVADRVAGFLADQPVSYLSGIDFISTVNSAILVEAATGQDVFAPRGIDRRQMVIDFFARLHRDDGGYARTPRGGRSSTYYTFLVATCLQLVDAPWVDPAGMIELVRTRQRDDGGFVETDPRRHSGTNPTAAAIGLLSMLDALDEPTATAAADFLARMQATESGMRANTRTAMADLLSTFTALVALGDLRALDAIDTAGALRFAESLQRPDGGFQAGPWDNTADVEYTFYGLGVLGLLAGA